VRKREKRRVRIADVFSLAEREQIGSRDMEEDAPDMRLEERLDGARIRPRERARCRGRARSIHGTSVHAACGAQPFAQTHMARRWGEQTERTEAGRLVAGRWARTTREHARSSTSDKPPSRTRAPEEFRIGGRGSVEDCTRVDA
jgi:hypothetical protein